MHCSVREDDGNNHTVQSDSLCEDENEYHAYEHLLLNCVCFNSCLSNISNCESSTLYMVNLWNDSLRVMIDHNKVLRLNACIPVRRYRLRLS